MELADSGVAQGWGTRVECQAAACGSVPAHSYIDTSIIMDKANPDYIKTQGTTGSSGNPVTADGGKTWAADEIRIEACSFS